MSKIIFISIFFQVEMVPQMGECLESLEYYCKTNPDYYTANRHKLPAMVQRLLADMYVCIYCPANLNP